MAADEIRPERNEFQPERDDIEPLPVFSFSDVLTTLGRTAAMIFGLVVIGIGLFYAVKVFDLVYSALNEPQGFEKTFQDWQKTIGGEELEIEINKKTFSVAPILATVVIGGGSLILVWISMGIMLTGAKIVSWTAGDHAAVKRILQHTLGRRRVG